MAKAGRGSDQFVVRFPEGLRDKIKDLADKSGRSMNAEILVALQQHIEAEATVEGEPTVIDGSDHIDRIEKKLTELQAHIERMVQLHKD